MGDRRSVFFFFRSTQDTQKMEYKNNTIMGFPGFFSSVVLDISDTPCEGVAIVVKVSPESANQDNGQLPLGVFVDR